VAVTVLVTRANAHGLMPAACPYPINALASEGRVSLVARTWCHFIFAGDCSSGGGVYVLPILESVDKVGFSRDVGQQPQLYLRVVCASSEQLARGLVASCNATS
jgi:hypothetical protein